MKSHQIARIALLAAPILLATVHDSGAAESLRGTWTTLPPAPTARTEVAAAAIGKAIDVVGGVQANSAAIEGYDPATNACTSRAPSPTPRDHLAAATVGDKIYTTRGQLKIDYARNLRVVEVHEPSADRWPRVADLPRPRAMSHTPGPFAYEDGIVYAIAGDKREERMSKDGVPFIYHTNVVALVYGRASGERAANGALFAEAPTMLRLLRTFADDGADALTLQRAIQEARDLIARVDPDAKVIASDRRARQSGSLTGIVSGIGAHFCPLPS